MILIHQLGIHEPLNNSVKTMAFVVVIFIILPNKA